MADQRFTPHRNFAWLEDEYSNYERARVVVLPVPYDSTASGWVGSREGPGAIIEASGNMELYDIGMGTEPYLAGIHTLPELAVHSGGPQAMVERIEEVAGEQIDASKFVVTLGGEHTVVLSARPGRTQSASPASRCLPSMPTPTSGTSNLWTPPYNHACTLRRISEAAPIVEVGLRSAEREEHDELGAAGLPFYQPGEYRAMNLQARRPGLSENVRDVRPGCAGSVGDVGGGHAGAGRVARTRRRSCRDGRDAAGCRIRCDGAGVLLAGARANAQLAAMLTARLDRAGAAGVGRGSFGKSALR